jgi:hypothetical protein
LLHVSVECRGQRAASSSAPNRMIEPGGFGQGPLSLRMATLSCCVASRTVGILELTVFDFACLTRKPR